MSDPRNAELVGVIERQLVLSARLFAAVGEAMSRDVPRLGRTGNAAVMVAGLIENYYTCLETAYQKISQHFENHLEPGRWHADLLDKMTLHIKGVRERVIGDDTHGFLRELLKFRHFKRYYFELEYDWLKLDYLMTVYERVQSPLNRDLDAFQVFLERLLREE